jgi:hypothetical protein
MLECQAIGFPALRNELLSDIQPFIMRLLALIQMALEKVYPAEPRSPFVEAAMRAVAQLRPPVAGTCGSPEMNFIAFRLLTALQWSRVDIPDSPVASALGAMFDNVAIRRAALRTTSNVWMRWAEHWIERFASEWRQHLGPPRGKPDSHVRQPAPTQQWPGPHPRYWRRHHDLQLTTSTPGRAAPRPSWQQRPLTAPLPLAPTDRSPSGQGTACQ